MKLRLSERAYAIQFAVVPLAICVAFSNTTAARAANVSDFTDYTLRSPTGQVLLPGKVFTPPEAIADPTIARPLMLYLHGGGARGTDNISQILQTPDFMVDEAKRRAAYLYVPQSPDTWASNSIVDSVMTMVGRAINDKLADTNRLYAAGYSNGGGGVWTMLSRYPNHFAAALTLAGTIPAAGFTPGNLVSTPILTAHARDDSSVSVTRTRSIVNGILSSIGEPLPNYNLPTSSRSLLVSNPAFEFHRGVSDSAPPGTNVDHFIIRPNLELLYYESPAGDHTGLLGLFYDPSVYGWIYSHSRDVPEPSCAVMVTTTLLATMLCDRSARSRKFIC